MNNYASIIRESVDIQKLARFYGLELNKSGFCKCFLHADHTPSMKFYPNGKGFYCFSCHAGGDCIDFVKLLFGISFAEACEKINMDCNLGLPIGKRPTIRQYRRSQAINRERLERSRERERLEKEYQDALAEWTRLDKNSREFAPTSPTEVPREEFVEALTNLLPASERLREAEAKLSDYKNRGNQHV